LQSGTGAINIGTDTYTKNIGIGNSTGTTKLTLSAGSGGIIGAGIATQINGNYVVCFNTTTKKLYKGTARNNCDTSSSRFKHDIADITLGLNAVMAMRPVSYTYNDNNQNNLGFVAEEVIKIDRRLVNLDSQGLPYSLNTDTFIPILAKGIQELNLKVNNLSTTSPVFDGQGLKNDILSTVSKMIDNLITKITQILATKVRTKTLCVGEENNETCIDKTQLDQILSKTNTDTVTPTATPTIAPTVIPTVSPAQEPTPEPSIAPTEPLTIDLGNT
jgi:hypothetical protein